MAQLLTKILGSEIQKKNVIVQADDGQVGGKNEEQAVDNWITLLKLFHANNIKINHKKVNPLKPIMDKEIVFAILLLCSKSRFW